MKQNFYDKMNQFQQGDPYQWQRMQPPMTTRHHQRIDMGDVISRLVISGVFAGLAMMISAAGCWLWQITWWSTPIIGIAVMGLVYWAELKDAKSLQRQINFGQPAQPPAAPVQHIISAEVKNGRTTQRAQFECDPAVMSNFARLVLAGRGFSEATAAKAGITQVEFNKIRDEFLTVGWATWKNPNWHRAGVILAEAGETWLKQAAEG